MGKTLLLFRADDAADDLKAVHLGVLGAEQHAVLFLGVADIIENVARDALAGGEDRDAGRIAHDELRADAADRLIERHGLLVRVERLLRPRDHLRRDIFLPHERRLVALIAAADVRQSGYETFEVALPVADRNIGEQIAEVAELGLNIVVIAQDVVDLDAGEADVERIHRELGRVEIVHGVAVDQLAAVGVVIADLVDLLAGIGREVNDLSENLFSVQRKVFARNIQADHQQIRTRGRLRQVDDLADVFGVHRRAAQQKARLRERTARLVHGNRSEVSACRHRGDRHILPEVEMRAVRLVREHLHAGRVREPYNFPDVRADAVPLAFSSFPPQ